MGAWGYVTFFRTTHLDALEQALARMCEREGVARAPHKPRKREKWDAMQYGAGKTSDRWALAFAAGRNGWSIVRTAPLELLAEPTECASGEHRLGIVARELGCEALHLSMYDGTAMIVAQASASGEVVLSGYTPKGLTFHDVELAEERCEPCIDRIAMPDEVHEALRGYLPDGFDALVRHLAEEPLEGASAALIEGKKIPAARVLCFARPIRAAGARLPLKLAIEEHPLGKRYVLDDGVWITETAIDAVDAERGAAFLTKIAAWLGVPVELDPGVPRSRFALLAPPAKAPKRQGMRSELLSIGDRMGVELLLHTSMKGDYAELEERSPAQREHLLELLTTALVGKRTGKGAVYAAFERVFTEPTSHAIATFAGDRLASAWWRLQRSAIQIEGHPLVELEGLATSIAATSHEVSIALVTPTHVIGTSQGYGPDAPTRVVTIDLETGAQRDARVKGAHAFARLRYTDDVLDVVAAALPADTLVKVDAAGLRPIECSASGDRCVAHVRDRDLWIGRRR